MILTGFPEQPRIQKQAACYLEMQGCGISHSVKNSFSSSIDGLPLEAADKDKIFDLEVGEIYSVPVKLENGAYLFQMLDVTGIDKQTYAEKKEVYRQYILQQKEFVQELKFMAEVEKEGQLKYFAEQDKHRTVAPK